MQFLFFHLVDGNLVLINSNKNADCDFEKNVVIFVYSKDCNYYFLKIL